MSNSRVARSPERVRLGPVLYEVDHLSIPLVQEHEATLKDLGL
jgi:hypothetical protein